MAFLSAHCWRRSKLAIVREGRAEALDFDSTKVLSQITQIYTHFANNKDFVDAIAKDDR